MTFTDEGTKVPSDWYPLAFANGLEWSTKRAGFPDRFRCLYRRGLANKALWYCGALTALVHRPAWVTKPADPKVPAFPR